MNYLSLKKNLQQNIEKSSLKTLLFCQIRENLNLRVNDDQLSAAFKQLGFQIFGNAGVYAKFKINSSKSV